MELDHTVVPARDKVASARYVARILGLTPDESTFGYFAPVRVNDALTWDFLQTESIAIHHYAFKVSESEFDTIFARIQAENIPYGSGPHSLSDMRINRFGGGRGVYFGDLDGHILELLTVG